MKVSGAGVSPAVEQAGDPTTCGCGAPEGIRTPNLLIRSQMLYPLSYGRLCSIVSYGVRPAAPGFAALAIATGGGGERI
jgi:hypothetical protein